MKKNHLQTQLLLWMQGIVQKQHICIKLFSQKTFSIFFRFSFQMIATTGISAIGVHGRTKDERPGHPNHVDFIQAVVQVRSSPVSCNTWGQFHQHSTSSFCAYRSRKHTKTGKLSVYFTLLGSVWTKAACRMLMKLTPGDDIISILLTALF